MLVHALIAAVRTHPKPSILLVFHSLDEVLAHFVGCRLWVSVLAQHNVSQLLLVPIVHLVLLLLLFFKFSIVRVETSLLRLPLHSRVVREFAFAALVAMPFLEELAEHGLGVDTEGNLLHLNGLEEIGDLLLGFFGGGLLLLTL